MIRLVACDLDGTLLDEKGRLPEGTFAMIRRLREKGVAFAAASGRQWGNLQRMFFPVREEMAFLCENGAFIDALGRRESSVFPRETAEQVIRDILSAGMELLISVPETCYVLSSAAKAYTDDIAYRLRNTMTVIDDPFLMSDGYIKLSGFHPADVAPLAPALQAKWGGQMHVDIAGKNWLDFTPVNKGDGIRTLCRLMQIPPEDVAAFGDQHNDVSMLDAVGHPFLMDTAPAELRQRGYAPCHHVLDTLNEMFS